MVKMILLAPPRYLAWLDHAPLSRTTVEVARAERGAGGSIVSCHVQDSFASDWCGSAESLGRDAVGSVGRPSRVPLQYGIETECGSDRPIPDFIAIDVEFDRRQVGSATGHHPGFEVNGS